MAGYFPDNAVEYFVSHYDYYQPEAYLAKRDLYIDKELSINERIEQERFAAVASLVSRPDCVVVSSACIYGLNLETFNTICVAMLVRRLRPAISCVNSSSFNTGERPLTSSGECRVRGSRGYLDAEPR